MRYSGFFAVSCSSLLSLLPLFTVILRKHYNLCLLCNAISPPSRLSDIRIIDGTQLRHTENQSRPVQNCMINFGTFVLHVIHSYERDIIHCSRTESS